MLRRFPIATAMVLLIESSVLAQRPAYSPEQLTLVRHTAECQLAPDGKTVAFVSDMSGALELWTVPASGGWPQQLTSLNERVADIRWSPDGKWLAFTSDYGGNERSDLFRVAAAGGPVEKLTGGTLACNHPRFSADGRQLAFTADPDPDRPFLFQLMVMDLASKKTRQLTHEKVNVLSPVWSPDGRTVAVTRSGDDQKGQLLLIDTTSGAREVIEPALQDGILWPAAFAPDGKALLLLTRNRAGFTQLAHLELQPGEAGKLPRAKGKPALFGPDHWDVSAARWTPNGIYFLLNEGGATGLYHLHSPPLAPQRLLPADGVIAELSLDATGRKLALLRENVHEPADVWVTPVSAAFDASTGMPQPPDKLHPLQITFSLMGGVKADELAKGEMIRYESFDKLPIHALIIKPRVNRLGTPPPAIVHAHGGPNDQRMMQFDPFLHVLAEAGFVVIAPNYRGSTGYGKIFEDANNKDWGGGDLKDLVAAVKHFGDQRLIDPKRVGITGGSYGGYLTLMALSKTPDVWAGGAERYGMPDLVTDYLLSKSRFGDWYETEMGNPKTDAQLFRERSPLLFVDAIQAPLLIFQGGNDTNVPKAESDLLAAILKELKKPHEYVVYGDEGHGFTRRKNLLDCNRRILDFFVQRLKDKK